MTDLETRYRAYLAALNERRWDDLVRHVHDELTYNGTHLTRSEYADMIAADAKAIPDLFFDPHLLVIAGNRVACRLVFDCLPQQEFLGFAPDGERFTFAEHVFYEYRDGRIAAVTSLIDRWAVAEQLRARNPATPPTP